jgi:hypothetical protein
MADEFNVLKSQIYDVLTLASRDACARLGDRFHVQLETETLSRQLGEIERILQDDLDSCSAERAPLAAREVPTTGFTVEDDTLSKNYDCFVILPVFNASDVQVQRCIRSVADNFRSFETCLIVCSNRNLMPLCGGDLGNIDHLIFRKPQFSLPEAYNYIIGFIKANFHAEDRIVALMDDDAEILDGQTGAIEQNLGLIWDGRYLAVSGHYYDNSRAVSNFQKIIDVSHTKQFVKATPKPYCHGGAVFMMKLKNFPREGIIGHGLGGITLNIILIRECAAKPDIRYNWYLYNNPDLEVYHPRKPDLFRWTATYLSYDLAWSKALSLLAPDDYLIWQNAIDYTSRNRASQLAEMAGGDDDVSLYALGNLYLTKIYRPLLFERLSYSDFKSFRISTHNNLMI